MLDAAEAARLGLREGTSVDAALRVAAEEAAARQAGLHDAGRLLARRSRSRAEIARAVGARHGASVAGETVEALDRRGLLDDAAHAAAVAAALLARGWGPLRIAHDLERAGVADDVAAAAIAALDPEEVRVAAVRAAAGRTGADAWRRVALRGFDEDVAADVAGHPDDG